MVSIATYSTYDEYQNSGAQWLGEVPKTWELTRLGTRFIERRTKVSDIDYPALSVTKQGILPQLENAAKTKDGDNRKLVKAGDFVINSRSDRKGSSGVSDRDGSVSLINIVLEPKGIHPKYSQHLLKSYAFIEEYYRVGRGIVADLWTTRYDEMRTVTIAVPSYEEQTAIANFLDKKTAQIDEAIAIKEKQIELLKERKQIIIQNAVTQGIFYEGKSDAPMKDSGVDWIGEIPEHWDLSKLKYYIDILPGYAFKSELYSSEPTDIPLLRGVNVSPGFTKWNEVVYWPENKIKGLEKFFLEEGDLVIAMDRPWVSSGIRVAEIKKADLPCLLLQRVGRIRGNKNALTAYIKLLLSTDLFLNYFGPMLTGISVPHISSEQIEDFCAPIPPVEEQERILEFLNSETAKHDQGISSTQQQIEKLKEYKTTLINSAVTGKIKVI
ncbi:restriction endonuclease subunit S [Marinomonas epiphytica]